MNLDLPTLLWVMLVTSFVLAASVLTVDWRGASNEGLAVWGWGLALHGLSYLAFGLRLLGWPDASIVLTSLLTSATIALHLLALGQFQKTRAPKPSPVLVWLPVAACTAQAAVLLEQHQLRNLLSSLILCLQAAALAWHAWLPGQAKARERGRLLLTLGSTLLFAAFAVRAVLVLVQEGWDSSVTVPSHIQNGTYFVGLVVLLLNTMGFVLMQKEHAVLLQRQQATHDPLTGVANRLALMEEIERAIGLAARRRLPLALLMIDIDFFKKVNDTYGHQTGDEVLRELTRRIDTRLRQQDLLARYGGEEFMVVLPGTGAEGARVLAEEIRRTVQERPFTVQDQNIPVTVSLGLHARIPTAGHDVAGQMIAVCDKALYAAKQNGRNRTEEL